MKTGEILNERIVLGDARGDKKYIIVYTDSDLKDSIIIETESVKLTLSKELWSKLGHNLKEREEQFALLRGDLSIEKRLYPGPTKLLTTQRVESLHHIIQSNRAEEPPVQMFVIDTPEWDDSVDKSRKGNRNSIPSIGLRLDSYVLLNALPKEMRNQIRSYIKENKKELNLHPDTKKELDESKVNAGIK